MEINPYAPPETETSALKSGFEATEAGYFFEVPVWKLVLMSVCSFGVYELYWFYRQWKAIKARELAMIRPFWRAVFPIFFCYQCFSNVRDELGEEEGKGKSPGLLATGFIVTSLTSRMPDPFWMISLCGFLFLLPVQRWATRVNSVKTPERDLNNRLSWKNWTLVLIGGLAILLMIISLFIPEEFMSE